MATRRETLRTAAILLVLAVPFALALHQERGTTTTETPAAELPAEELPPSEPEPPAPAPATMPASFFEDTLGAGDGRVALAGDLGGAALGARPAELERDAPALWRWAEAGAHPEHPQATALLSFDRARLASVQLVFPDRDRRAREALADAWGVPLAGRWADGRSRAAWYAADERLRVTLVDDGASASLVYERYLPLDVLLADAGDRFGFARRPILGAAADDLVSDFGDQVVHRDEATILVYLPPAEFALGATSLRIELEADQATGYSLIVEEPAPDRALALVEARWGAPEPTDGGRLLFADVPGASVLLEAGTVQLTHRR